MDEHRIPDPIHEDDYDEQSLHVRIVRLAAFISDQRPEEHGAEWCYIRAKLLAAMVQEHLNPRDDISACAECARLGLD